MSDDVNRPLSADEQAAYQSRAMELIRQIQGTAQATGYFPTPDAVIDAALDRLALQPGDRLVDLGCGDGRVLVAAAKRGLDATGVEADSRLAVHAAAQVARVGPGRARVALGSFSDEPTLKLLGVDEARGVFLFLQPWALDEVMPMLMTRLPVGARVASYAFRPRLFRRWAPEAVFDVPGFDAEEATRPLYLWRAPGPPKPTRKVPPRRGGGGYGPSFGGGYR